MTACPGVATAAKFETCDAIDPISDEAGDANSEMFAPAELEHINITNIQAQRVGVCVPPLPDARRSPLCPPTPAEGANPTGLHTTAMKTS